MQSTKAKPFRVSASWVYYAHQPGSESGNSAAAQICDLITERDYVLVSDASLVKEIISVAELYVGSYGGDPDDRMRSMQAARIVKRGNEWLAKAK